MAKCGGTLGIIMENWLVNRDSSNQFETPIYTLDSPVRAINYQFKWEAGVVGVMTLYGSIYPDPYYWEEVVGCECITVDMLAVEDHEHEIVSLSGVWLTLGFLQWVWTPDAGGSTGNINAAMRVVPT